MQIDTIPLREKILIIAGHYGSGKTELALNLAFAHAGEGITLVDLDIVNPFFRANELRADLEKAGVRVLAPTFANTTVDVPSLPPDILSIFVDEHRAILDVGGDHAGARALGQYRRHIEKAGYAFWIVANARRPLTRSTEEITVMAREIQRTSGLTVTGLINATNLGDETTADIIAEGLAVIGEAAKALDIPLIASAGLYRFAGAFIPYIPIERYLRPSY
jgi:hypothetical protein